MAIFAVSSYGLIQEEGITITMVVAAADTLIYLNAYGATAVPDEARVGIDAAPALEEEVYYMPDGNIVIPRRSKGSGCTEPEANC